MSMETHPYRSAPFTETRPPFPARRFGVMVAAILALHSRDDIARWQRNRARRTAIATAQGTARAEMNARAYVRSAYGVDPWVRCSGTDDNLRLCDVVVGQAAPFRLWCDTTPDGGCSLGGAR